MKMVDVFWSHQIPYCYFARDRLLALDRHDDINVVLRTKLPRVIRDGDRHSCYVYSTTTILGRIRSDAVHKI